MANAFPFDIVFKLSVAICSGSPTTTTIRQYVQQTTLTVSYNIQSYVSISRANQREVLEEGHLISLLLSSNKLFGSFRIKFKVWSLEDKRDNSHCGKSSLILHKSEYNGLQLSQ